MKTQGAPTLGVSWSNSPLSGLTIKEGSHPSGPTRSPSTRRRPIARTSKLGDKIQVITDTGTYPVTITALVGLGDTDGFAGATLAAFDPADGADTILGANGTYDSIDIKVAEGVDPATVIPKVKAVLPQGTEVVTRAGRHRREQAGARHDHHRLRHGPADLRLHHGVRQRLPHQQRVPDHDRPTAAGAGDDAGHRGQGQPGQTPDLHRGPGDVRRSPRSSASPAASGVAKLLIQVFNSAGAGFPSTATVLQAVHDRAWRSSSASASRWRRSSSRPAGRPGSRRSRRCAPSSGSKR